MRYTKFSALEGGSVTVVTCTIHTLCQQHFGVLALCPFVGYVVKRCGMSLFSQILSLLLGVHADGIFLMTSIPGISGIV